MNGNAIHASVQSKRKIDQQTWQFELNFSISFIILRESSLNPSCTNKVLQLLSKLGHIVFKQPNLLKSKEKKKYMIELY